MLFVVVNVYRNAKRTVHSSSAMQRSGNTSSSSLEEYDNILTNEEVTAKTKSDSQRKRNTYRGGVPPTELISLPWTREKGFAAQRQPWYGKPFDAASFWEGYPIWLDEETKSLAKRRGRYYPPIPPKYAYGNGIKQKQLIADTSSSEYSVPKTYYTQEEESFWEAFTSKHPRPPDVINRWLHKWSEKRHRCMHIYLPRRLPDGREIEPMTFIKEPQSTISHAQDDAKRFGLPIEAATDAALYWEYVSWKRMEYIQKVQTSTSSGDAGGLTRFLYSFDCPAELVTNPPSDEEIRATRGWRIAYLQRLRREGADELYVAAYKKAWEITEEELKEEAKEGEER